MVGRVNDLLSDFKTHPLRPASLLAVIAGDPAVRRLQPLTQEQLLKFNKLTTVELIGELQYEKGALPKLSTFRTDIGAGIAFGNVGFYIAKALSDSKEPLTFFVRIKQRF